jgi:predicted ThiF/HesA family dinucleotide-utilizing enzyme
VGWAILILVNNGRRTTDMNKLIYHMGTGTYFGMDDDVYVIDLDEVTEPIDAETMDNEGDEIAIYWGRRLIDVTTDVRKT